MKTYLALFLAGCAFGALVNGWRLNAEISDLKATHAEALKAMSDEALTKQTQLQNDLDETEKLWATAEAIQYRTLRNAQNEINQLRSDVATGRKRLLVNATCPASSDKLSEASPSASMDNGAAPRLTKDAEQAYYDLKGEQARVTSQLLACQARLR